MKEKKEKYWHRLINQCLKRDIGNATRDLVESFKEQLAIQGFLSSRQQRVIRNIHCQFYEIPAGMKRWKKENEKYDAIAKRAANCKKMVVIRRRSGEDDKKTVLDQKPSAS